MNRRYVPQNDDNRRLQGADTDQRVIGWACTVNRKLSRDQIDIIKASREGCGGHCVLEETIYILSILCYLASSIVYS